MCYFYLKESLLSISNFFNKLRWFGGYNACLIVGRSEINSLEGDRLVGTYVIYIIQLMHYHDTQEVFLYLNNYGSTYNTFCYFVSKGFA